MNVLLIDDHPLVLAALHSVMREFDAEVDVVSARTARHAHEALGGRTDFDLVLLDLHLGDSDGFALLESLRNAYPALPIVVISASDSNDDIMRAIYLGAMGFVPKRASNATLFDALRGVLTGHIYVPPVSLRTMAGPASPGSRRNDDDVDPSPRSRGDLGSLGLTPRQREVLALLMKGQSNKLIARALNLSVETVKDHVAALLRLFKVKTRTQAVLAVSHLLPDVGADALPRRDPVAAGLRVD